MAKGFYLSLSQSQLAYEALEEKLVNLTLAPGEIYSEGQLAREVELGRTPLREALQKNGWPWSGRNDSPHGG